MFGVTVTTGEGRVIMLHLTVHTSNIAHLSRDRRVACKTAVCHCCRFPGRGMTCLTVPADIRVRSDPTQDFAALRAQWSGVI